MNEIDNIIAGFTCSNKIILLNKKMYKNVINEYKTQRNACILCTILHELCHALIRKNNNNYFVHTISFEEIFVDIVKAKVYSPEAPANNLGDVFQINGKNWKLAATIFHRPACMLGRIYKRYLKGTGVSSKFYIFI